MDIEYFEVVTEQGTGYGYSIGGVYQQYHPEKDGFVFMSKEEAEHMATIILQRLQQ